MLRCQQHARIQKVLPEGGSTLTRFFFSDNEGERIQIPLKVGHHPSKTPFKWHFAGGPMMAQHWMLAWFYRDTCMSKQLCNSAQKYYLAEHYLCNSLLFFMYFSTHLVSRIMVPKLIKKIMLNSNEHEIPTANRNSNAEKWFFLL